MVLYDLSNWQDLHMTPLLGLLVWKLYGDTLFKIQLYD